MEKNFLDGMKNQERKNSLKNAMERYNRFKSHGKLTKNKNANTPKIDNEPGVVLNICVKEEKEEIINENNISKELNEDSKNNRISNFLPTNWAFIVLRSN